MSLCIMHFFFLFMSKTHTGLSPETWGPKTGLRDSSTNIYVNFHVTVRPATIPLQKLQH